MDGLYTSKDLENYIKEQEKNLKKKVDKRIQSNINTTLATLNVYESSYPSILPILQKFQQEGYMLHTYESLTLDEKLYTHINKFDKKKLNFVHVGTVTIWKGGRWGMTLFKKHFPNKPEFLSLLINDMEDDKGWRVWRVNDKYKEQG